MTPLAQKFADLVSAEDSADDLFQAGLTAMLAGALEMDLGERSTAIMEAAQTFNEIMRYPRLGRANLGDYQNGRRH